MAKNDFKKPMSLALAAVLATSMVPAQVFADGEPAGGGTGSEQTQVVASAALAYSNGYYDITSKICKKD